MSLELRKQGLPEALRQGAGGGGQDLDIKVGGFTSVERLGVSLPTLLLTAAVRCPFVCEVVFSPRSVGHQLASSGQRPKCC